MAVLTAGGMKMEIIDIVILAVIGLFVLLGLWKGLVKAGISLIANGCALALTYFFAKDIGNALGSIGFVESMLGSVAGKQYILMGIATAMIFIVMWLLGGIVKLMFRKALKKARLSGINRLLGGVLYGGIALLFVSVIMLILDSMSGVSFMSPVNSMIAESTIAKWFAEKNLIMIIYNAAISSKAGLSVITPLYY